MAKSTTTATATISNKKRRNRPTTAASRIAKTPDNGAGDGNPRGGKQSKLVAGRGPPPPTTPEAPAASSGRASAAAADLSQPPMRPRPPKKNPAVVPASAVLRMPPPPIGESGGDDENIVTMIPPPPPPAAAVDAAAGANIGGDGGPIGESTITRRRRSEVGEEEEVPSSEVKDDEEPEEEGDDPPPPKSGGAALSWLLASLLLFGLAGSAGFLHQRIVQDLRTQLVGYRQDLDYSQAKIARLSKNEEEAGEHLKSAAAQVESIRGELMDLMHEVRYLSRQRLMARYGPGPTYPVELELEFPGPDGGGGGASLEYVTVDLDGDNMPHAVLTFLSQVDAGLYRTGGFGFHHAGDHVVLGSPITGEQQRDDGGGVVVVDFGEVWASSGLSHLLFHEHSDAVPHVPYTIGFSGRGPNLYFNVLDNTEAHRDVRDPCFGTVTRGRHAVKKMHSMAGELNPGDWKEIERAVIIRSVTLIHPPPSD